MQIKNFVVDRSLKELTIHRTVELPIACYETTINQNINGYIPLHWHDELQFVLIVKGEAVFQINEETLVVQEGDGLFINSGCLHMAEEKEQSGCVYICLNVSPYFVLPQELYTTYVYPYIQATNLPYLYIDVNETWGGNILDAIMKINQLIQQKSSYFEIDIAMKLMFIWQNLLINGFPLEYDQIEMQKSNRMKQMLNWIHLHYAKKIMLDDIAKAGQLSRSECCRYFKRILKTTPLRYVTDYRIQKSLSLLQQAEANVTDVAYQVGFNSTSYFIDKFRKSMNMTPLAYKKYKMEDD
ncbi:AraC-like DNA-binding protein/mannose-6-phosphate isomerase-like protein (cupin superfamily) [Bacillus pakistanensis]|uniref:AraC-like DNA-binding protein/mannose-6-phosphate isomerase-like protein (Cupin superfamily) n=1 Tax=Rossellomorea pakistanensis TaxID=992288 RepID=A0ABS2NE11_9BACI|nr:AraC family transcriptional regulator [Bacillus pakistanensis]MBM7586059.1 AraC-like DNA-binding protein/mannose-6-phosphate isomerase-like protein (cupin superfamily) [Bacillus pakistanensis]